MKTPSELSIRVNQEVARILVDPVASGMVIAGHELTFEIAAHDDGGGSYNVYTIALDGVIMGGIYVRANLEDVEGVMFDILGMPIRLPQDDLTRLNNFVNLIIMLGNRIGRLDGADPVNQVSLVLVTREALIRAGIIKE